MGSARGRSGFVSIAIVAAPRVGWLVVGMLVAAGSALAAPPTPTPSLPPAELPARQRVDVIYTGQTSGVSTAASYGAKTSVHLLWDYITTRHGAASLDRTGWVLRQGPCILLDPADLRTERAAAALRRPPPRSRILEEEIPYLESDHVIVFQYPPVPGLDLLSFMQRQNREVPLDPVLRRGVARLREYRTAQGTRVLGLDRGDTEADPLAQLSTDPRSWEMWWAGRGYARLRDKRGSYYVVVKMRGQGARRFMHIGRLRGRLNPAETLLLSAGDEVDTTDPASGTTRATRDLDFEVLGALRYTAIVPGARELYSGLAELRQRAERHKLPLVATNLSLVGEQSGQPAFPRYIVKDIGGVRVGILGLVGLDALDQVHDPPALKEELRVDDPMEAVAKTLMAMYSSTATRPDFVIAVSNLRDKAMTQFLAQIRGVSVFIGDFSRAPAVYPAAERIDARHRRRDLIRQRSPLLETHASWTWVGHVQARFARPARAGSAYQLQTLEHTPQAITADMPLAAWLHRRVMAAELQQRRRLEAVLVPALDRIIGGDAELLKLVREDPEYVNAFPLDVEETERTQIWFTPRIWSSVVANTVREATGADVAAVRAVPRLAVSTPGEVLFEYVLGWASTEETLALYELSGAQLKQLLQLGLEGVALAGIDVEENKIGGRDLEDAEYYRVALGSGVAAIGPVSRILGDAAAQTTFALAGGRVRNARQGRVVRLREIVVAVLEELRRTHPRFSAEYRRRFRRWLVPGGKELTPRWMFRAESVTFAFSNYANYPGVAWQNFPGVRETRVNAPNNYTLQLKGALALTYDAPRLAWETRGWFDLARSVLLPGVNAITGEAVAATVVKTADDLQFSTELRLKVIGLDLGPKGKVTLLPYVNATFDTEFGATHNLVTGETYPHQKELYGYLGVVTFPNQLLHEVRLAGIMRSDFAVQQGRVDGGLLFGSKAQFTFWRARLDLGATLRYFFPTKNDTQDRLGLIVQAETKLAVQLVRDVAVVIGADLFLFRAKRMDAVRQVPSIPGDPTSPMLDQPFQRGTSASLILSAGLTFDRAWKF